MTLDVGTVLDATVLIAAAGGGVTVTVQLAKMAGLSPNPRTNVLWAASVSALLVVAFTLSEGQFSVRNLFTLLTAWITITATGAGLHTAIKASAYNVSPVPPPAPVTPPTEPHP